jgi:xanthine dehydrogenase small subunit
MTILLLALDAELILARGVERRVLPLRQLYRGYKDIDLGDGEIIEAIRFPVARSDGRLNFEKISKRTYLDIASVNSAAWIAFDGDRIAEAFLSAGGVAPIPKRLTATEEFLRGRRAIAETARQAADIARGEIAPISDVRGSAEYKRLLLGQLVIAHLHVLGGIDARELVEATA